MIAQEIRDGKDDDGRSGRGERVDERRFEWHPTYAGRTLDEVTASLRDELGRDQRAYALVLEGAEEQEGAALASVLELEKRWGEFDFGWAETDPAVLADRIAAFEWERESRRALFPFEEYRRSAPAPVRVPGSGAGGDESGDRPWWAFWRKD